MSYDNSSARQRKPAMVPPITVERGTPCPTSPLPRHSPMSSGVQAANTSFFPQLGLQPNLLGSGVPTSPVGYQASLHHLHVQPPDSKNDQFVKLEPISSSSSSRTYPIKGRSPVPMDTIPHMQQSFEFAVPKTVARSQPSHQYLQLPSYHMPAQSPTLSDVSSIRLSTPHSPLSRLPSSDPMNAFKSHVTHKKPPPLPVPTFSGLSSMSGSIPDLDDHQPPAPPNSLSPAFPDSLSFNFGISPRNSARDTNRKRAHSISPFSDFAEFGSIIRASPNSLVPTLLPSPGGVFPLSPGAMGHLLNHVSPLPHTCAQYKIKERKTSIEQNQNLSEGTLDTTITYRTTFSEQPSNGAAQQCSLQPLVHMGGADNPNSPANTFDIMHGLRHGLSKTTSTDVDAAEEIVSCQWNKCNVQCASVNELVQHIERTHLEKGVVEEFVCQWKNCPRKRKPFNARYKLVIHMRIHSGEKPNKCPFANCTKAFSRLENLKIHIRTHTGEKPYICQYQGCGKSFSNSSDRSKHQKTHYDQKPYACTYAGCDKRYTDPSSLRKHARTHAQRKKPRNDASKLGQCLHIHSIQSTSRSPHKQNQASSNKPQLPKPEHYSQPQFYLQPPSPGYPHSSPSDQSGLLMNHLSPNTLNQPSPSMMSPGHMMPGTYHSPRMPDLLSPYMHNQLSPQMYLSNPNSPAMSHMTAPSPKPLAKAPSNPNLLHQYHHQQPLGPPYAHQQPLETLYPTSQPPSYEETLSQYPMQQGIMYSSIPQPHPIDYSHTQQDNLNLYM